MNVPASSYADLAAGFRSDAAECLKRGTTANEWCVRVTHMRISASFTTLAAEMDIAEGNGMVPGTTHRRGAF